MKYTQPRFTLPAGSSKITQEQWDRAFSTPKVTLVTERQADGMHYMCLPNGDVFRASDLLFSPAEKVKASRNSPTLQRSK